MTCDEPRMVQKVCGVCIRATGSPWLDPDLTLAQPQVLTSNAGGLTAASWWAHIFDRDQAFAKLLPDLKEELS